MEEQEIAERPLAWVIADTETTGLTGPACEIALREIDPDTFENLGEIQSLIDPECEIEPRAQEVHGITAEMLVGAPTMEEFISTPGYLDGAFDGRDIVLIGHNVGFDLKRLGGIGNITSTICTLFHARQLIGTESENHKLGTLREHFGFPPNEAHRAMADVATTQRLLRELIGRAGRTLRDFHATMDVTVHRMPFGKHRGELLMEMPRDYLVWITKQADMDANLRKSAEKILKVKAKK